MTEGRQPPETQPAESDLDGAQGSIVPTEGSDAERQALVRPVLALPAGLSDDEVRLWEGTRDALFALPTAFRSRLVVQDVLATDLHAFNSALGASIELQVVGALNNLRSVWDPDSTWALYRWERQSQRFPDVVLRTTAPGRSSEPVMGIEMKGWYVLAREKEPSFRFTTTAAVCAPMDLLAIVPWALDAGISGSPRIWDPYVVSARDAALYRNYHWSHVRRSTHDTTVAISTVRHAYPRKDDPIADVPAYDGGGNFGRYARTLAMDDYMAEVFRQELAGIPLSAWQAFLKRFSEPLVGE